MVEENKLPKGWEWKRISEISECLDSKRVPLNSKEREQIKGDIPYYGANGEVDRINKFLFDEELLLIAEDGGSWGYRQNCAYIINGKAWINNHAHILRIKSEVLIKFVEAYLNLTDLTKYISGTTRGKLNQKDLNNIPIPIPPLNIQKHIVELLEKVELLKANRDRANKEAKRVLYFIFKKMFGDIDKNEGKYPFVNAEEIFDIKLGKMLSAKNYKGTHLKPYLRNINVKWGHLDLEDINEMDFDEKEFEKYKLERGDILVCEGGEVGRTAIYNGEIKDCCYQNALHRLRAKKPIINSFYFINFMKIASDLGLILQNTSQVTIAHFTAEKFKKFKIMLPPIKLQEEFALYAENLEKIKKYQIKSTDEINNLFDALMQRAFKGELIK